MLKLPQLFAKIGKDKYIPIDVPWPGRDVYAWDDVLQRIILYSRAT